MPFVIRNMMFGPNQFAYTPERGARDALAYLAMVWITALAKHMKVAVYCSDVSGAFDRVQIDRLADKLRANKNTPNNGKRVCVMVAGSESEGGGGRKGV